MYSFSATSYGLIFIVSAILSGWPLHLTDSYSYLEMISAILSYLFGVLLDLPVTRLTGP